MDTRFRAQPERKSAIIYQREKCFEQTQRRKVKNMVHAHTTAPLGLRGLWIIKQKMLLNAPEF
jgi:hypothetical protein